MLEIPLDNQKKSSWCKKGIKGRDKERKKEQDMKRTNEEQKTTWKNDFNTPKDEIES